MNPIYRPLPNCLVRTALKLFAPWLPDAWRVAVHGPIRVRLPEGTDIVMDCNPTSNLARLLFWGGYTGFEYPLIALYTMLARRADVIVDVGANIGYYSLVAAAVNPSARIFSFEPLPAAFRYLVHNVALNGFATITPERIALADENGRATFYAARKKKYDAIADHLVATGGFNQAHAAHSGRPAPFEVEVQTLDHYAATVIQQPVDLLKLDTETTEHMVLAGAEHVLRTHRPTVLCEVLPGAIEAELEAIFRRFDYVSFRAAPEGIQRVDHFAHEHVQAKDHIIIPAESVDEVMPLLQREMKQG